MQYMIYQILVRNVIFALYFATKMAVLGRPYSFVQKAVYIQTTELNGLWEDPIN